MGVTILLTGFGPFPGAPFNPTAPLVERLARLRRPALGDARLIAHVFQTSYAAIDRELPALIERHRPATLLMFGLAPQIPHLRIETRARNAISLTPGADRATPSRRAIAIRKPATLALRVPARRLLAAARAAGVPAALSRDAGSYLCNYLCWRAAESAAAGVPCLTAFIHVPNVRRKSVRSMPRSKRLLTFSDLARAGGARRGLPIVNDRKR